MSAVALGLMTVAASIGGGIRHPEILADPSTAGSQSVFSMSAGAVRCSGDPERSCYAELVRP